jgi:uncharacterized membrane protein YidH (DUF202 family)
MLTRNFGYIMGTSMKRTITIEETGEQEALAEIRTLLALERTYLSKERTTLSEFRTGIALILAIPPAITIFSYVFSLIPMERIFLFDLPIFTFLAVLTVMGIWIILSSRSKLKKVREKKKILRDREVEVMRSSKAVYHLLYDCITLDDV